MTALNILGSFQDPKNLDEGAAKLVNVRVVPRKVEEGKPAQVRFVGAPGLVRFPSRQVRRALRSATRKKHLERARRRHDLAPCGHGCARLCRHRACQPVNPVIRFAEDRTALAIASNLNVTFRRRAADRLYCNACRRRPPIAGLTRQSSLTRRLSRSWTISQCGAPRQTAIPYKTAKCTVR